MLTAATLCCFGKTCPLLLTTALKAAESRVLQLNRLYVTLSRCNVAMVRSHDEQEMLEEVCRAIVQSGGMALAWVGLVDASTGEVSPVARFGANEANLRYLDDLRTSVDGGEAHGRGPTGTAIREGVAFWCQDFEADPRTAPWHESAARFGWRASAALPLRRGGKTVGALTFYMTEPDNFDEETRELLLDIASDVSFGMDNFDREAARASVVDRLRESEERYRLLIDHSQDAVLLTAPDGRLLSANAAAGRVFRCSESELIAGGHAAFVDPADPALRAALAERERSGSFRAEFTLIRSDGERFPAEVSSSSFRDHSGELRSSMIIRDISAQKLAIERLAHLAQHDALTDLPNRLLLTDRLNVALARAQRDARPLALLFLDLDRFKTVNDVLGHGQGDLLLVEAAARLEACVRASDTVSRQGGDEFIVLLADIESTQDAARVSQKVIEAVARPFVLAGAEFVLTASIGIACHPENGADAETLMRNADAAMYAAKQGGRNRFQFYSAEMNARSRDRLRLESDLRQAIARHQLFVAYQPQVDLGTGQVAGAEALLRWQHPQLGLVPPADFIGIAEDSGQIAAIGAWVLETACKQQAAWLAEGLAAGVIAVNVAAHQFRQVGFADSVAAILASSGLRAEHLELEVTESAVMQCVEDTLGKLGKLDRLGVKLSIDDFGTGYSSLSYLKQFPVYRLKIDQSFTRGLPDDAESGAIAQAVISMGHSLGLNVLAEGVETTAQEERLRELWCDAAQGYLYAQPVPADAYAAFLRARDNSRSMTHGNPERA
jgi:diguanylate cyclase (GGDEF)-like protein/PAS domain S-box-containing protein